MKDERVNGTIIIYIITFSLIAFQFYGTIPILSLIDSLYIKHIAMWLCIGFSIMHNPVIKKDFKYRIFLNIAVACIGLMGCSILMMLQNGCSSAWIEELYYIIIPYLFVWAFSRDIQNKDDVDYIMDIFFNVLAVLYIIYCIFESSRHGLKISFVDSTSPFELNTAHMFLVFLLYYTYRENRLRRLIAFILTVMSWKRLSLIIGVFIFFIPVKMWRKIEIKKIHYVFLATIILLVPLLFQVILTDEFSQFIYSHTGIDLVAFMKGRFDLISAAYSMDSAKRGLGSMSTITIPWYGSTMQNSMHNDIVRIYLETSIIGLGIFVYEFIRIGKTKFSFLTIAYMLIASTGTHLLGSGGIPYWVLVYCLIIRYDSELEEMDNENIEYPARS